MHGPIEPKQMFPMASTTKVTRPLHKQTGSSRKNTFTTIYKSPTFFLLTPFKVILRGNLSSNCQSTPNTTIHRTTRATKTEETATCTDATKTKST